MLWLLTNPYFVALGVPILFIVSGAIGKKLVRGAHGWDADDFYLGVELTLGSISAALIHIFDLIKHVPSEATPWPPGLPGQIGATAGFIAVCFFAFIWILSTHQDWHDAAANRRRRQMFWLGGVCNLIGAALMFAFIISIKGVQ